MARSIGVCKETEGRREGSQRVLAGRWCDAAGRITCKEIAYSILISVQPLNAATTLGLSHIEHKLEDEGLFS